MMRITMNPAAFNDLLRTDHQSTRLRSAQTFSATEQRGVRVEFNGEDLGPPGARGDVVEVVYTPDGPDTA
jgi:hypothetical protein